MYHSVHYCNREPHAIHHACMHVSHHDMLTLMRIMFARSGARRKAMHVACNFTPSDYVYVTCWGCCTPSMYISIDAQIANHHSPFMLHICLNSVLRWDFRYDTCTMCACVKPRTRSLRAPKAKLLIQNLSAVQRMLSNYIKLPPMPMTHLDAAQNSGLKTFKRESCRQCVLHFHKMVL